MRWLIMLLVCGLAFGACATDEAAPETPAGVEVAESDEPFSAEASDADAAELSRSDLAFAIDLLGVLADGSNVFVSPVSITTALGMLEAGARGNTLAEISDMLHETLDAGVVHDVRGAVLAGIEEPEQLPEDVDGSPFEFDAANSVWAQRDYPILADYLDVLASSYGAGMFLVDFVGDAEGARVDINDWVADATHDRILDLIKPGVVDELTRLVLTNAVWFKGGWVDEFDPAQTADRTFTTGGGSTVDVPMMSMGGDHLYFDGDGFQAVWLPYWGGASMVLLLPDESPQAMFESFDAGRYLDARAHREDTPFSELALPRFELNVSTALTDVLPELGMVDAFDPDAADLTGINPDGELFVTDVVHQAFVSVDEVGTEAAAATAVIAGLTAAPIGEPVSLVFDRPFVFLIEDDATGMPLFAGVVEDPTS